MHKKPIIPHKNPAKHIKKDPIFKKWYDANKKRELHIKKEQVT